MIRYISQRAQIARTFCSGIGKTAVIYPASFLVATAMICLNLGVVFYAGDRFGASPTHIGFLGGTWSLCYMCGCLFLKPVFSRIKPRHSMLLATSGAFVCVLAMLAAAALPTVYVAYGSLGLFMSFFWPPMMGWLSLNIEGSELNRAMGVFNVCWSSGVAVGPLLSGWLSEQSPAYPLVLAAALTLAAACLVLGGTLVLTSLGEDDHAVALPLAADGAETTETPLRFPAWLGVFASYGTVGALLTIIPLSATAELGLMRSTVGALFLIRAAANSITMAILGKTNSWHFRGTQMFLGTKGLAVVMLALPLARGTLTLALAMTILGSLGALSYANSLFHGVSGSKDRSGRMAIHESLLSGGMVAGAALGGFVYEHAGATAAFCLCGATLFAAALGQAVLVREHGKARKSEPAGQPVCLHPTAEPSTLGDSNR